ncbi:MAG: hypothetical protein FWH53_07650 [Leptospirales bacterium]|nr:hypothetical protein [Leptospirales bacterium]
MKRIIKLLIIILLICANIYGDTAADEDDVILYSEALYYKNLALQSNNLDEINNYLNDAIERLKKSKGSDASLSRVYFQLADIYTLKNDLASAEQYAKQSIEKDNSFFPPYSILYNIMMNRNEYKESAALIEKYLAVDPDEPYALYLLGVHYYKYLNDSNMSLAYFEREINASKSRDTAAFYLENSYYNIGYIYYTDNQFVKSFHYFTKAYDLNDSNISAIYMLALSAFGYSDIVNAEKYADMYLTKAPGDLIMEYILGSIYYINDSDKAIEYLSKIKRSQTFEGLVALGLYYEITDDNSKAESIINSALKYRPDLITLHIAEARIKYKENDKSEAYKKLISAGALCLKNNLFKAAEDLFYKALEIKDSNDDDIYYFLAKSHEANKRYAIAISYYKRYYEYSRESNVLVHIGYIYAIQKNYGKAYTYFIEASKNDPENPETYFFWGLAQIWEGKNKDAKTNLLKAIALKNDEENYYLYLAIIHEKLNEVEQAIENSKLAIEYNKGGGRAYNFLGYLYADRNMNIDEAMQLVLKALELEPDNGAFLDSLGWIYYRKNDYVTALKNLLLAEEKLDEIGNPDSVVYDHIGDTYLKLDNKSRAIFYWDKALKLENNSAIEEKIKINKEHKNEK